MSVLFYHAKSLKHIVEVIVQMRFNYSYFLIYTKYPF